MAVIEKCFIQIGIYRPDWSHNGWPWHFHYEDGCYLSAKYRACGWKKAAEFETKQEAREFFHQWPGNKAYRMELLEVRCFVTVPDPVYPPEHPRSILDLIRAAERSTYFGTAHAWYSGRDIGHLMSRATLSRHRKVLLPYGIDIYSPPKEILQPVDHHQLAKRTPAAPKLRSINGARNLK